MPIDLWKPVLGFVDGHPPSTVETLAR